MAEKSSRVGRYLFQQQGDAFRNNVAISVDILFWLGAQASRGSFTHFGSLACKLVDANVRKKLCIVAKISVQVLQFCVQRSSFSVRIHISDIKCNRLTYLNGALFSFFSGIQCDVYKNRGFCSLYTFEI